MNYAARPWAIHEALNAKLTQLVVLILGNLATQPVEFFCLAPVLQPAQASGIQVKNPVGRFANTALTKSATCVLADDVTNPGAA
ncbi:MAG: hypothetical protein ACOY3P_01850 [Planctomycetota bacterium]